MDLQFKNINAGSNKVAVSDDVPNKEVDIDINEANIAHSNINDDEADKHRLINDIGTGLTDLWSANKINAELGGKSDTGHSHVEADITDLDHTDADAIHDNEAGEINAIAEKVTPADADVIVIEDSGATYNKKKVQIGNLPTGGGSHASSHETGGADKVHFADLEHDEGDATLHDTLVSTPHVSAGEKTTWNGKLDTCDKPNLDDQDDVVITTPADNEVLAYDNASGNWINQTPTEANLSEVGHDHVEADITDLDHYDNNDLKSEHPLLSGLDLHDPKSHNHVEADITDLNHNDVDAIHDNVNDEINAITEKPSPVGADKLLIEDSAAEHAKKKVQISNLPEAAPAPHSPDHESGGGDEVHFADLEHDDTDATLHDSYTATPHVSAAEKTDWNGKIASLVEDTSPQLGGNLGLNSKGIILEGQTKDAGANIGDLVYFDGTNWKQADADAEITASQMLGVLLSTTTVLIFGVWTTTGLTAGDIYYVSTTAGGITNIAPSATGDIVRIIGYALSTTELVFMPDGTFIEVS